MDRTLTSPDLRRAAPPVFIGRAPSIERVRIAAERVAKGDDKVLIT